TLDRFVPGIALAPRPVLVIRPDDLLVARFSFVNLSRSGSPPVLRRAAQNRAAYLVVDFQPQHVVERAFYELPGSAPTAEPKLPGGQPLPPDQQVTDPLSSEAILLPARAVLSGSTRLVFTVGGTEIPYSL
ncbi:MAG: hypothetical protein AAGC63_10195, partial [Propionicimonas sp.]|nr:hypothetical protein [Propionicimonas sp.]